MPAVLGLVPAASLGLSLTGQWLLGIPVDWGFARGWRAVRLLVSAGLLVVLAGFVTRDAGWAGLSWGPTQVYRALDGGLGVLVTVAVVPLWLVMLTVTAAGTRTILERVLGRDNPLSE